jgi:hypothetical protein
MLVLIGYRRSQTYDLHIFKAIVSYPCVKIPLRIMKIKYEHYLLFSVLISLPTSFLASNRFSMISFVVFMFS